MISYTLAEETVINDFNGEEETIYKTYTYLNGQPHMSDSRGKGWNNAIPQNGTLQLGGETFEGVLDDIRIYDGALSANEIAKLYTLESQEAKKGNIITVPAGSLNSKVYAFAVV